MRQRFARIPQSLQGPARTCGRPVSGFFEVDSPLILPKSDATRRKRPSTPLIVPHRPAAPGGDRAAPGGGICRRPAAPLIPESISPFLPALLRESAGIASEECMAENERACLNRPCGSGRGREYTPSVCRVRSADYSCMEPHSSPETRTCRINGE